MNDFALVCQHAAADAGGLARLDRPARHHRLQCNITSACDYVPLVDLLADRLERPRWNGEAGRRKGRLQALGDARRCVVSNSGALLDRQQTSRAFDEHGTRPGRRRAVAGVHDELHPSSAGGRRWSSG